MDHFPKCAACGYPITGTQHVSSLYGSHHHLLCEGCCVVEEYTIEHAGTNDISSLLATYGLPNDNEQEAKKDS